MIDKEITKGKLHRRYYDETHNMYFDLCTGQYTRAYTEWLEAYIVNKIKLIAIMITILKISFLAVIIFILSSCNDDVNIDYDLQGKTYLSETYHFNRKSINSNNINRLTAYNKIEFTADRWYQNRILLDKFNTLDRITDSGTYVMEYPILTLISHRNGVMNLKYSSDTKIAFTHFKLDYRDYSFK